MASGCVLVCGRFGVSLTHSQFQFSILITNIEDLTVFRFLILLNTCGFVVDSGRWKFKNITRVSFTLTHTSLVTRLEFLTRTGIYGALVGHSCPLLWPGDKSSIISPVCLFTQVSPWFSWSTNSFLTIYCWLSKHSIGLCVSHNIAFYITHLTVHYTVDDFLISNPVDVLGLTL